MIWLTPDKLAEIGVTTAMLRHNRSKWRYRETAQRGRNGKPIREWLLESLPDRLQQQYLKMSYTEIQLGDDAGQWVPGYVADSPTCSPAELLPADDDATDDLAADGERRLTEAMLRYEPAVREAFLQEAARLADIVERYDSVNPKRKSGGYVAEVLSLREETACNDLAILKIEPSRGKPKSPHTLEAWSKEYRRAGLATFLRKPPAQTDKIDNRKAEFSAAAMEWVERNWRKFPSPQKLHQAIVKEAKKHHWTVPARGYFWRRYQELPNIVKAGTFGTKKNLASKWGAYVPRTYEDITALQILCGDHSVRDVTVMLPDGSLTRPWLTTWQCMRTGLIWGWHLDLTPSSATIGLAYVNGVKTFGAQPLSRPEADFYSYLYTDQGKDYRCKMLTGDTLEFKTIEYGKAAQIENGLNYICTQQKVGFMEEMGLKHILARGYNAKEKPVERYHKDVSEFEKNTFTDEYCGKDAASKPDAWVRAWHKHQRLMKKFGGNLDWLQAESPFMSFDDYRDTLAEWINEYNNTAHKRTVLSGSMVVPIEEYERLYTTRYEISEDVLHLLLMKVELRKIGKIGVSMFQSNRHFMHPAMSQFKGQQIEVRWTDGDYKRIWAVLPDKRIVEAELVERSSILNPNKKTHEMVARTIANENRIRRDHLLLEQSQWRGETTEDRVARLINPAELPPEQERMVVNAPKIVNLTRFDKPKFGSRSGGISTEQVENAEVIQGMFGSKASETPIREEWD